MRKRSAYRPKPVLQDPVGWVLAGFYPAATAGDTIRTLRIKNHGAIAAVMRGEAELVDADALLGAFNMAAALGKLGVGADWLPEIAQAQDALRSAGLRPKFLFTGPEIEIVNTAMTVHDLQLDDPKCTVGLLDKALQLVRKDIKHRRSKPLYFPTGATA